MGLWKVGGSRFASAFSRCCFVITMMSKHISSAPNPKPFPLLGLNDGQTREKVEKGQCKNNNVNILTENRRRGRWDDDGDDNDVGSAVQ